MSEIIETDLAIVGAGTSGAYLAWKLADAGCSCVVLESDELESLGTHIGPFHMEETAFEEFGIPKPEGDELLHVFSDMTMWSPGFTSSFTFSFPTFVMDKPLFIQRLQSCAAEAGARLLEKTPVTGVLLEGGVLKGLKAKTESGKVEVRARLVIDASGIDGTVRTMMPASPWFETGPIADEDTIFVYMETWRDLTGDLPEGVSSYPFHQGWCAPGPGDTRIVGIGMAGSYAAAEERHRRLADTLPFTGTVVTSARGRIPYRRPPLSLVDNGLMVVGDAAMMNKPFSGEGVTSAFTACVIAAKVAAKALADDDLTREALWPYNTEYFRGQGAKFAFLTATLPGVLAMSSDEMDFFLGVPGLMTEEGSLSMQRDYEIKSDQASTLKALPELLKGILGGKLSIATLLRIGRSALLASVLKFLYERYPERSLDFGGWARKTAPLWRKVDAARYRYFSSIL